MNEQEFYTAFDRCLTELQSGKTLHECLALYPDYQEELRPALEAAQTAWAEVDHTVPNAAVQRSRARLLAKADQLKRQRARRRSSSLLGWFRESRAPRLAFAVLLVTAFILVSWQGFVVASAKALPGDSLYAFKRGAENLSLQIAPSAQLKRAREVEFERRRLDEVIELLAIGRIANVDFEGILNERTPARWIVGGVTVLVDANTRVTGVIEPGMVVEVFGETQPDGTVQAAAIDLHSYQFIGRVDAVSESEWVISGVPVRILRSSQIDAAAGLDDRVIALVEIAPDGTLQAQAILRLLQPSLMPTAVSRVELTPSPASGMHPTEITGQIESISGNVWTVAGTSFVASGATELKDGFAVGDFVKVHLQAASDGSLLAREIEFESGLLPTDGLDDDNSNDGGSFDDGDNRNIDDNDNDDDQRQDHDTGNDHDDDDHGEDNDNGDGDDDQGGDDGGSGNDNDEDDDNGNENGGGDDDDDNNNDNDDDDDDDHDDGDGDGGGGDDDDKGEGD